MGAGWITELDVWLVMCFTCVGDVVDFELLVCCLNFVVWCLLVCACGCVCEYVEN